MSDGAKGPTVLVTGVCALVSGATGFLGRHLAAALHKRGFKVRALARPTADVRRLSELGVEIVQGDLSDSESLAQATEGQSLVFHTAGKVTDWGPRAEYFRANLDGTRNVIAACQRTGVSRLVHVSSLTVLGLPRAGAVVDERAPYAEAPRDAYTQSKIAAEKLVRESHGVRGLATTVVRPGVIWGPGDITIVPRFTALLRRGRLVLVDEGRNLLGLSHVENLSQGVILAAQSERAAGEVFHVTDGEEITARAALEEIARVLGVAGPRRSLPYWAAYAIAGAMEGAARLTRRREPPPMTRYGVRLVSCDCRYDLTKARNVLGYQPKVTFKEGIRYLAAVD